MPRWTIADVIAAGDTIYANCSDPRCFASTKLDLKALAQRLGRHGTMTSRRRCSGARDARLRADRTAGVLTAFPIKDPGAQARCRVWLAEAAVTSVSSVSA